MSSFPLKKRSTCPHLNNIVGKRVSEMTSIYLHGNKNDIKYLSKNQWYVWTSYAIFVAETKRPNLRD